MPDTIRSPQNPRIKRAVRLREAGFRRETGLMIIDGERELRQAVRGRVEIQELFVVEGADSQAIDDCFDNATSNLSPWERSNAVAAGSLSLPSTTFVSSDVMEKIAYGDRRESVVAIAKQPMLGLESFDKRLTPHPRPLSPKTGRGEEEKSGDAHVTGRGEEEKRESLHASGREGELYLVIDSVEKPGNLGAMLRTADAAGVTGVLLTDPVCEVWNPNAIRASMGAIFRVPTVVASAGEAIDWLRKRGVTILAARVQASGELPDVRFTDKTAIVVGSEAEGLGKAWLRSDIEGVRLPMLGSVDSLNVSVSAAILLYHAADRIGWFSPP